MRSNTKKAIENIRNYIMKNYDSCGYNEGSEEATAKTFEEIASVILKDVKRVKGYEVKRSYVYSWQEAFEDWAAGLPGLLDTCYYYNRSAIDDLAEILEQTEAEKAKYKDERKAEQLLSYLIFRELRKAAPGIL